ncbi:MAG: pyruvate-binding protein, partial [Burkholderiales bacterium PBB5]
MLYSPTALTYGAVAPTGNTASRFYFDGRSDNFAAGSSLSPANARLDPEALRVSNDGRSVFIADEYGPYVYQFDRSTGARTRTFTLPSTFGISALSSAGATEISGNTTGRVANKGMEGLAITPNGQTLYGFMQSPLAQDGGDGGRYNRIVQIDIASGTVKQFAYDNRIGTKNYNSSELLAINDHQFLV